MKKLLVIIVLLFNARASAQSLPITIFAQWQPNPVADKVTSYTFKYDANAPIQIPVTINTTCNCIQTSMIISTTGNHIYSVIANNLSGPSLPSVMTFLVTSVLSISSPNKTTTITTIIH